jgi:glycine/D-amino acid oxidase-like deaminating enzyme
MKRHEMLKQARERAQPWDIIIIGGGATGAGVAVDAATRGYSTLLLEQHDLAKAPPAEAPSWRMVVFVISNKATSRSSWRR